MSGGRHWAHTELVRKLKAQKTDDGGPSRPRESRTIKDSGTVFLFDPAMRERLDEKIRSRYFPAVIEGLRGSSICVHDEENVLTQITDKRDPVATRELVFLLAEPPRPPAGPGSPPWYVCGRIECSIGVCMINFDLILGLPLSFPLEPVLELMGDRRMQANPPRLSIEYDLSGRRQQVLSFFSGKGAGAGVEIMIEEGIKKHLAIIRAVNRLELQWDNTELFSRLSGRIIAIYGEDIL